MPLPYIYKRNLSMKVLLSLSGGMDSTTVLGYLLSRSHAVECISFTYGSKHNEYELEAALKVAEHYGVPHHGIISLASIMNKFTSNLLKSGGDIPEGHYNDASMAQTVVPGRNIIFISIMTGLAWSLGANGVALGIHQGDHAIYPDCRREFFHAMNEAIEFGTDRRVELIAPFLNTDKTGILEWGMENEVPYHLTRTCYKDQPISCGKCGACRERLEGWANIRKKDPIEYEV